MITYKLTECDVSVSSLLSDIDCKLTELGKSLYNNIIYDLNKDIPSSVILDLLNYKRILQHRTCNSSYASDYTTKEIAGRVKLLIYK